MTLSPSKFVSNLTSSTTHRGVEVKEIEIANTYLDMENTSGSTQVRSDCTRVGCNGGRADERVAAGDTGSYFQVVVEKHRSRRSCGRVPVASSPQVGAEAGAGAPDSGLYVLPHPVLFACYKCGSGGCTVTAPPAAYSPEGGDWKHCSETNDNGPSGLVHEAVQKEKPWKIFGNSNRASICDEGPDRVEVYYFERGCGEYLRTGGGAREAACERATRAPARFARTAFIEVAALVSLVVRTPLSALLLVQRCFLELGRDSIAECAHNMSDYVLKPALAVVFNAAIHPVLVCAANVARALRDAAAPLAHLVLDAVEPLVRVLGAVRLVDVHVHVPSHHHSVP